MAEDPFAMAEDPLSGPLRAAEGAEMGVTVPPDARHRQRVAGPSEVPESHYEESPPHPQSAKLTLGTREKRFPFAGLEASFTNQIVT